MGIFFKQKATHKKGRFEDEFIEDRRKKLEVFMNRISNHPQCSVEPALIRFLKEDNMSVSFSQTNFIQV